MSRTMRTIVLATALISVLTGMAASADAVTWHNSGDTSITATGGPGTLSSTGVTASCPSESGSGSANPTPAVGAVWTAAVGTISFNNCLLAGISTDVECSYALTAQSQTGSTVSGTLDITCGVYQFNTKICHAGGTVQGTYFNPVPPSTFARVTSITGGNVTIGNGPTGSCPLGNGDRLHISETTITATNATGGPAPHLGPIITRTA